MVNIETNWKKFNDFRKKIFTLGLNNAASLSLSMKKTPSQTNMV